MKNLFFVMVAACIVMLSACGKSAGDTNLQNSGNDISKNIGLIIGKWYYSTDTVKYTNNGTVDSTKSFAYFQTDNIVFNSDGTGVETRSGIANNFTFSVINQIMTMTFATQQKVADIKTTTGGVRALASNGYNITATIKSLSSTQLVMVFETVQGTKVTDETVHFTK